MADESTSGRVTRGIPHTLQNLDSLSFDLGISQQQNDVDAASAEKFVAERRSKKIHDPSRIRIPSTVNLEKNDFDTATKRRKTSDVAHSSKGKNVVGTDAGEQQLNMNKQASKFLVKRPPTQPIRYASYMNHNIKDELKEKLTDRQFKLFSKTVFGKYMEMQVDTEVQGQLFRCFMIRELKRSNSDAFVIDINGTELTFGLFEFALITGLKCYGDEVVFDEGSNRLLDQYFSGSDNSVLKMTLNKCFEDKDWGVGDNADEDVVKIAILYFIHNYMLSSEKRNVTVPRHHFDLVESEQYNEHTWGKEAFDDLIKSIHHKMDKPKQFCCLRGFPFAMQVWIYECCSNVDPNLMVKTGSRIPRMFNWRTVNPKPSVNYLMLGMFKDGEDISCKFNNIVPTISEVEKLAAKKTQKNDASKSPPHKKPRKMSTTTLLVQKSPATIPKKPTVGQSSKKSASVVDKSVQSKEKEKAAPSVHRVPLDDVSTNKSVELTSLRQELNQFRQEVLAEFKVVFTELKDLRKTIDKNFKKVLEHDKGKQNSEKDDDSETHVPLHDGNIHQQADDYMDHDDDIHMETDTGDVHPTEEKGLAPDIQVSISNDIGDTLKASTEEIAEGGDHSGEPKTSVERPVDPTEGIAPDIQVDIGNESGETMEASTEEIAEGGDLSGEPKTSVERSGKHTMEEQKRYDDSNNSEMIAQVLANIAESEMTNEQVHAEKTEENTSSTVLEEPQAVVCNAQPLSQWLLPDEYLPSQTPGKEIMLHPSVTRATRPSSSSGKNHVHGFDKKYPFQIDPITGPLDVQMVDEYRTWLRNGLLVRHDSKKNNEDHYKKKKKAVFDNGVKYNFGITTVNDKNYCCVFVKYRDGCISGHSHIAVIFYYFRKKGKYDKRNNFSFTTVDCLFKQRIDVVHHAYRNVETQTNVANEEQVLIEYVKGHRLIANVPWHTVDNVLIPMNIQEENHWLLRLYVYNSYQSAGHNAVVRNEIKKLATLLPHFLHLAGFYVNKKSIDLVKDPAYADKGQIDILEVVYVDNLPHQTVGSTDCGVFVAAYAEYLTSGERIPDVIDAHMQRMRYSALLWDYAEGKVADNAESDNEVPPRPIRPAIDYDTVDAIDV
ncbi:uncharacterized protein LOC132644290 [Lycium barbarum]|uniref:uncharacterized protein LOC132644290 n=1 Tax=Lycium barbarum TaxID=112863 RepID=UPI00293F0E2E|nr:uncharacterized protein LOC132644290 [Lycium barbarum]